MIYNQNNYTKHTLGNNPDILDSFGGKLYSIARYGCYIVSMCNMFQQLGIHIDPVELNNQLKANGCFQAGNGRYIANTIQRVFPQLKEYHNVPYTPENVNEVLNNPKKVGILHVDYKVDTTSVEDHFVGLYSANQILDPAGGAIRGINTYRIIGMRIFELTQDEQNNMNKATLITHIKNNPIFDESTKQHLEQAVLRDDAEYLLSFAGSVPRANQLQAELEVQRLQAELNQTQNSVHVEKAVNETFTITQPQAEEITKLTDEALKIVQEKENFDFNKLVVGFPKANMDKVTYTWSVAFALIQLNSNIDLGVSNREIMIGAFIISVILVLYAAIKQILKETKK